MAGRTFWFFASNVGRKIGQTELKKKAIAQQHWEQRREELEQSDLGRFQDRCNLIVAQYSVLEPANSSKNYV